MPLTNLYSFGSRNDDGNDFSSDDVFNGPGQPTSVGWDGNGFIKGVDGNFYGVRRNGFVTGGTVVKLSPNGTIIPIHYFSTYATEGNVPVGRLVQDSNAVLYGVTEIAGTKVSDTNRGGTIYKVNPNGTGFAVLHQFDSGPADGNTPGSGLIIGSDGRLYGTTYFGGTGTCQGLFQYMLGCGVVFSLNTDGSDYRILRSFGGSGDGVHPVGELLLGPAGYLYGATGYGGAYGAGTLYRMDQTGANYQILYDFGAFPGDGAAPGTGLTWASDGNLYGTTFGGGGGYGTVFELATANWVYSQIHVFTGPNPNIIADGAYPTGELVQASNGDLFGVTALGGPVVYGALEVPTGYGVAYRFSPGGTNYQLVYAFNGYRLPWGAVTEVSPNRFIAVASVGGPVNLEHNLGGVIEFNADTTAAVLNFFGSYIDGVGPESALVRDAKGFLYGVTFSGGTPTYVPSSNQSCGTIYRIDAVSGDYFQFFSFPNATDTDYCFWPVGALAIGKGGHFYGATVNGGSDPSRSGAVFSLSADGKIFTLLHSFRGAGTGDGGGPEGGVIVASDGYLYGTTSGGGRYNRGTVFKLAQDGSNYQVLHSFGGSLTDGIAPWSGLIEGTDGNLYGTTNGLVINGGTVFKIAKDGSGYSTLRTLGPAIAVGLVQATNGLLYGAATGQVFTMSTDGSKFSVLHTFSDPPGWPGSGALAAPLVQARDGFLYGVATYSGTHNCRQHLNTGIAPCGVLFKIAPDSGQYTEIHEFRGAGDGNQPVGGLFENTDGFMYGTTYNGGGVPFADQGTVFRFQDGPAIPHLAATSGPNQVLLTWPSAASAASYNVYQGTASGNESVTPVASGITGNSVVINGLDDGTTYYFTLAAVNVAGTSLQSNEVAMAPLPAAATPLFVPAEGSYATAQHVAISSATSGAAIYYTTDGSLPSIHSTPYTAPVIVGHSEVLSAVAIVSGHSVSAVAAATYSIKDPPARPSQLRATSTSNSVTLSWTGSVGATSYKVFQGSSPDGESALAVAKVTGTTAAVRGLQSDATYYFIVRAFNSFGASPASGEVHATTRMVPAVPVQLAAAPGTNNVNLSWSASASASSYEIYIGTSAGQEGSLPIRTTSSTSTLVSGLKQGATYYFEVKARGPGGLSAPSDEAHATTIALPSPPQNLAATPGASSIVLNWSPSPLADSYVVYESIYPQAPADWTMLPSRTTKNATTTFSNLGAGPSYYFVVKARNIAGFSAPSNEVSTALILPPGPPGNVVATPGAGYVALRWSPSDGAKTYSVYVGTSAGGEATVPVRTTDIPSASVTKLASHVTYYFTVKANNVAGSSHASAEVSATTY